MSSFMLGADTIDPTLEAERITLREKLKATPGTAAKADVTRYYTLYGMLYEKLSGEALAAYVTEKVTAYFSGVTASGQVITYGTLPESKTVSSPSVSAPSISAGGTSESLAPDGEDSFGVIDAQGIQAYRVLTQRTNMKKLGTCEQWPGGKEFYPINAVISMLSDVDFYRYTAYDYTYLELKGYAKGPVSIWTEYWAHRLTYNYQDTARYFATLEAEYDVPSFLSLLKLHRSAGVETQPAYSIFASDAALKKWNPLYDMLAKGVNKTVPFVYPGTYTQFPIIQFAPYNPLVSKINAKQSPTSFMNDWRIQAAGSVGALLQAAAKNPDKMNAAEIVARQYGEYFDYANRYNRFCVNVMRFRERVLAHSLFLVKKQLDTAQLEDQQTLIDLVNYFANEGRKPYTEIGKDEFLEHVLAPNGQIMTSNFPCNFGEDMITISYTGSNGKANSLTIKVSDCLKMQYEAAVWIFVVNQDKYFGRMAQLEDSTAVLRANGINLTGNAAKPFQIDPWQNPFLVFDLKASKESADGKPVYKDTAAHFAQKPEAERVIVDDFVPLKHMELAPIMAAKYLRAIPGAGGYGLDSPADQGATGQSNALWILGAIAAAGSLYLMNK